MRTVSSPYLRSHSSGSSTPVRLPQSALASSSSPRRPAGDLRPPLAPSPCLPVPAQTRERRFAVEARPFTLGVAAAVSTGGRQVPCCVSLLAGYRHIDCAAAYRIQKEVGLALKKLFEDGLIKREDLFITSKLWAGNHAPDDVLEDISTTLEDLQLDYLDLYLIHGPFRIRKETAFCPDNLLPTDIPATWGAMEKLYDSGKALAIGVSNFSCKKLEDLLAVARVPPAVNQVECHPVWQQDKLRKLCLLKGVHLSAYSPFGSPGSPGYSGPNVLSNPIVVSVAQKLQKTPGQVALRWGLQMGQSVLPKSACEARIKENFDIFNWSIPEDLMAEFSKIKQVRLLKVEFAVHPHSGYSSLEDIWDGEVSCESPLDEGTKAVDYSDFLKCFS